MTAYARASIDAPMGRIVVEIHSINRKMLDLSLYLPKDLLRFDIEMRKWIGRSLERGQVTLRLHVQSEGMGGRSFSHTLSQLKSLKENWEEICHELHLDASKMLDLPFLVSQMQSVSSLESKEEEESIKVLLQKAVDTALENLMQMKETEGKTLVLDIQKRLKIIEEHAAAIELKKELPLLHYQNKLIERLKSVGSIDAEAEERIAREVALLAEKMDVTEELVRLRSHMEQFRQDLLAPEKAVGRKLDFLSQEMHREINTLGSKSSDSEISLNVVKMKSELDKIREQVQNIE